jgi:hypothetical protein
MNSTSHLPTSLFDRNVLWEQSQRFRFSNYTRPSIAGTLQLDGGHSPICRDMGEIRYSLCHLSWPVFVYLQDQHIHHLMEYPLPKLQAGIQQEELQACNHMGLNA